MSKKILLESGVIITIPKGAKFRDSLNASDFPETPKVVSMVMTSDGHVFFKGEEHALESMMRPFVMFVPAGTDTGHKVKVAWVEKNCAKALPASA